MYKFLLCSRYLSTRPIGLVSIISVMLGVATLIIVNSVMLGFHTQLRQRLHGIQSDIMVESPDINGFPGYNELMVKLAKIGGDRIEAMTPVMEVPGLLSFELDGFRRVMDCLIVGIDPQGRSAVGDFRRHLLDAEKQKNPSFNLNQEGLEWRRKNPDALIDNDPVPNDKCPAIVGFQMAVHRRYSQKGAEEIPIMPVGSEVVLSTIGVNYENKPPEAVNRRCVVVDWFKCDMSEYDAKFVFVPLEQLQRFRIGADRATSIQIKLKDYADAPAVVEELRREVGAFLFVHTWEDRQQVLLQAVKVERWLLNFILFFIIAVAGFGILAIFFMIVVEKTRDIGVLKALGASDLGVMGVFLSYALVLGVIGCVLGAVLGISFTLNINPIERTLSSWTGFEIFPRNIYYFKEIPAILEPWVVLWTNILALGIAVAAAVLPARRAARLRPVEALRYE